MIGLEVVLHTCWCTDDVVGRLVLHRNTATSAKERKPYAGLIRQISQISNDRTIVKMQLCLEVTTYVQMIVRSPSVRGSGG